MSKSPLATRVKYTYGVADLFQSTMNNTSNYMFVYVLGTVMMFTNEQVLMISGISSTVTLFCTFLTGLIVSGMPAMKWGRHRSFIYIFAPITAACFVLKFTRVSSNAALAAILMVGFVALGNFTSSLVSVSHAALVNVFTKDPSERGMLASHRATCVAMASVITSYTTVPLVEVFKKSMSEAMAYSLVAVVVVSFYLATMYYTANMAKNYEQPEVKEKPVKAERPSIKLMLFCLIKNPNLIAIVIADISRFCGNLMVLGTTAYFYRYVLQDYSKMATYTLWAGIVQTCGAYTSGAIKQLSSKAKIVIGELGIAVSLTMVRLLGFSYIPAFIFLLIYRFFQGFSFSMFFTLYADSVVYGEWKTGVFVPGFTSNMYSISARIGETFKGWILPAALIAINFDASIPAEEFTMAMRTGILNVAFLMPACFRALGGIVLLLFFRLTPEKLAEYQAEIDARKAAKA